MTEFLKSALPKSKEMDGAVVKLIVEYPREWDTLIDVSALRKHADGAFEFHLVKRPQVEARVRLPEGQLASSVSPLELLDQFWRAAKVEDADNLQKLAQEILSEEQEDMQ